MNKMLLCNGPKRRPRGLERQRKDNQMCKALTKNPHTKRIQNPSMASQYIGMTKPESKDNLISDSSSITESSASDHQSHILSDSSSSSASFDGLSTHDLRKAESGKRLLQSSLLVDKMTDLNIDTVSSDNTSHLSSDWFNSQEYGYDNPI